MAFLAEHPECAFVGTLEGAVTPNGYFVEPVEQFNWRYVKFSEITLGGRFFGDPTVVFSRQIAEQVGFHDPEFNNEIPLWYRLLKISKGAVLGKPLYFSTWSETSLSRNSSPTSDWAIDERRIFLKIRDKYDPKNAAKLRSRHAFRPEKAGTKNLKQGLDICLSAGDRKAAVRLTWNGWKVSPLSLIRMKLLLYAFFGITGVRTGEKRKPSPYAPCPSPLEPNNHRINATIASI
jgi:hypothetical protein